MIRSGCVFFELFETERRVAASNLLMGKESASVTDDDIDEKTIRDVLAGDTRAFERLVMRHQDSVGRFIYKIVPNDEDREEVCQDVFVKIFNSLHQFRFDAKFSTWLYQIAYRTAISFTRRKRLETEDYIDNHPAGPEADPVMKNEIKNILDKELTLLKIEERTIVTLHYMQDISIDDISRIVERPSGTVKSILYRVRQKLHDRLAGSTLRLSEAI